MEWIGDVSISLQVSRSYSMKSVSVISKICAPQPGAMVPFFAYIQKESHLRHRANY